MYSPEPTVLKGTLIDICDAYLQTCNYQNANLDRFDECNELWKLAIDLSRGWPEQLLACKNAQRALLEFFQAIEVIFGRQDNPEQRTRKPMHSQSNSWEQQRDVIITLRNLANSDVGKMIEVFSRQHSILLGSPLEYCHYLLNACDREYSLHESAQTLAARLPDIGKIMKEMRVRFQTLMAAWPMEQVTAYIDVKLQRQPQFRQLKAEGRRTEKSIADACILSDSPPSDIASPVAAKIREGLIVVHTWARQYFAFITALQAKTLPRLNNRFPILLQ